MALKKDDKADLRGKYQRVFEICLIIALLLLVVSFKYFPDVGKSQAIQEGPQELFKVEDVQNTKQENRPPPPPKPPIPIEAPSEDVLNDIDIASTEIDINAQMSAPPPPKEEKKEEEPTYFVAVEEMPEPIGGIQAIQSKIVYPEIAKRAGVEGKVYVLAFVDETGTVTSVKLIKGLGAGCDECR
jgi:periplasmic protein TonB